MGPKCPNTTFPHLRNAPLNAKTWHQCLYTLHLINTVGVKQALLQMEHVLQYLILLTSFIKIFCSIQVHILVKVITNVPIEYVKNRAGIPLFFFTQVLQYLFLEMCTGNFQESEGNARPPEGTPCQSQCIMESGRWGSSFCNTLIGGWGAECVPCTGTNINML